MVSDVDEFNRARALIDRELERARLLDLIRPTQVLVGAMLEVPALAFMLPQLMRSADFVSIGSNDLLSLAFAVDRTNPRVARRYDNLNPASLTLIRLIVQSAAENSGDLSLCGEMAGRLALDAMALLGLGIRTLSMQPGQIGRRMPAFLHSSSSFLPSSEIIDLAAGGQRRAHHRVLVLDVDDGELVALFGIEHVLVTDWRGCEDLRIVDADLARIDVADAVEDISSPAADSPAFLSLP